MASSATGKGAASAAMGADRIYARGRQSRLHRRAKLAVTEGFVRRPPGGPGARGQSAISGAAVMARPGAPVVKVCGAQLPVYCLPWRLGLR